jgi:hypothetical protein
MTRHAEGDELLVFGVVERLREEFEPEINRETVVDVVRQCHHELQGIPAPALPELVERLARQRLLSERPVDSRTDG